MPHVLDLGSRKFWRLTGRKVDLAGREQWLDAPVSRSPRAGLLPAMEALNGPGFDVQRLRPEIRDFYECTAAWQMEVWTGWAPVFWPAGELVSRLRERRASSSSPCRCAPSTSLAAWTVGSRRSATTAAPRSQPRGRAPSVAAVGPCSAVPTRRDGCPAPTTRASTSRSRSSPATSGCSCARPSPATEDSSWSRRPPVERPVRDHPRVTLAVAGLRPPRTISTFSVWRTVREMEEMVHGHSGVPDPARHATAMAERERRDFHHEFATYRFRPLSEHGSWEGRTGIGPTA